MENFEEGAWQFHNAIRTDGYGVSVVVSKPKPGAAEEVDLAEVLYVRHPEAPAIPHTETAYTASGDFDDYDIMWGLDPGQIKLFTATNNTGETIFLSTSAYRRGGGFHRSARRINRELNRDIEIKRLQNLIPTKKTAVLKRLKRYLKFFFRHGRQFLQFYRRKVFRKLRFERFALKTSYLDRSADALAGKQTLSKEDIRQLNRSPLPRTIIGYGDCGAAHRSPIKGWPRAPVKTFAKNLARRCELVLVDEYRTSKIHSSCTSSKYLTNQMAPRTCRGGVLKLVKVHQVLHCKTRKGGCGWTVNRDVNASKNILAVLMNQLQGIQRPARLARGAVAAVV